MIFKKSQMEMMGLVVIVILISLVMLVVLTFMIRQPESDITKEYYESQLATNTVNALLRTTSKDCKGHDMTTLAKDCVENQFNPLICEDGQTTSCEYINDAVAFILEDSLGTLKKNYILSIYNPENEEIANFNNSNCPGEREASQPQPLATDRGMMIIQLFLCNG